ncbi:MAG: acyclic terpene utilization AtuA family protein, partial [Candidatus Binatia bacterium]
IRIANSSGYWGDDPEALLRQVSGGDVDYVTADYLAEITMVILERQRRANPSRGFAYDFIGHLRRALPEIARRGIRVVANAGGVNVDACREAIEALCRDAGVEMRIGVVDGGDLLSRIGELRDRGVGFDNMDTGAAFAPIGERLVSAHAYLGARPIAAALGRGAQIVITGRTTDAALALGPMIHELGWKEDDWDRLSAGTIAGHVLECGAQVTGGNYTDFEEVPRGDGWIGYPIVEIDGSGDFVVTKHPGTGGLVNRKSVTEQLLYEIGDPRAYLTPDVAADFTSVTVEEVGRDRVRVSGARGRPAPADLKVSAVYTDGFRAVGMVLLSGPRLRAKGKVLSDLVWSRIGREFADARSDLIGADGCWLGAAPDLEPNEGVLRFAVRDGDRKRVERFANMLLGFGLQGPPGLGMIGGRPDVQEAYAFWPTLVPRELVTARVSVKGKAGTEQLEVPSGRREPSRTPAAVEEAPAPAARDEPRRLVHLVEIAYARSGDKGDSANIGVAARSPEAYAFLRAALTPERVREHYRDLCRGRVERYELPNLHALNFVLREALGGGGTLSLRVDHQGKTLAQGLLRMEIEVPQSVLESVRR